MQTNLTEASREWFNRGPDERYLSIQELKNAVEKRRHESWSTTPECKDIRVIPTQDNDLRVRVYDPTKGEDRDLVPSNWAFGQLSGYAGAPAGYLRKLPAELAAINLQWGLENHGQRDDALVLGHSNGSDRLRAVTTTTYGRIWDIDVVRAVEKANFDGRWVIPAASYTTTNPKRATTLYASDRDVFIFLVDPKNPIEVGGEQLFRGFFAWNSEVGAAAFGLTTFLYRYVCDNRIVWGATDVKELRIRHTRSAPERFAYEGAKYLKRYAEESTETVSKQITAARNKDVMSEINSKNGDTVESWLQKRGFTKAEAKGSVEAATMEMGQARSLWDVINGVTAYSRSVTHTDDRISLETKAGKLLDLVG